MGEIHYLQILPWTSMSEEVSDFLLLLAVPFNDAAAEKKRLN